MQVIVCGHSSAYGTSGARDTYRLERLVKLHSQLCSGITLSTAARGILSKLSGLRASSPLVNESLCRYIAWKNIVNTNVGIGIDQGTLSSPQTGPPKLRPPRMEKVYKLANIEAVVGRWRASACGALRACAAGASCYIVPPLGNNSSVANGRLGETAMSSTGKTCACQQRFFLTIFRQTQHGTRNAYSSADIVHPLPLVSQVQLYIQQMTAFSGFQRPLGDLPTWPGADFYAMLRQTRALHAIAHH
ncbi:hypothetical protein CHU98_g885 [Xylaria longipes]|nr:hypothetical protein CHU98_g885 [Xylaria longipes]